MKALVPILIINGSDSTGASGIQSDIKVVKDLGAYAVTAVTSVTVQNTKGISLVNELSTDIVVGQIHSVFEDCRPKAVKVCMVNNVATIRAVRDAIAGCQNIVASPVVLSSHGKRLMDDQAVQAFRRLIIPRSKVLIMKCTDVEIMLNISIQTTEEMVYAAELLHNEGAEWVMLRGSRHEQNRVTALLSPPRDVEEKEIFFSSYNIDGWQRHGVGGASSTAIATRLALGDDVPAAVDNAHEYLHSQIVYSVDASGTAIRPKTLYNSFLSLIADHCRAEHEVCFYASAMSITPRYLSQITKLVAEKTPKQIINDYLLIESRQLLLNTSLSVQEISNALGFSSQILFGRFIKKMAGCSPKELRKSV